MKVSPEVKKTLETIRARTAVDYETLLSDFEKTFKSLPDDEFPTPEEKEDYALDITWNRWTRRLPTKEFTVYPVGLDSPRITSSGDPMCSVYVLTREGKKATLRRVVFKGDYAELVDEIQLFHKYTTQFGQFSGGDLIVDSRTSFEEPHPTKLTPENLLKLLKLKVIRVGEAPKNLSKVGSDGYVDTTDWKVVRSVIARRNKGKRPNGTKWYLFTLSDRTAGTEPVVTPDGNVVNPGLTVWLNERFYGYVDESEVMVFGTIVKRQRTAEMKGLEAVQMNGYLITPVYVPEGRR